MIQQTAPACIAAANSVKVPLNNTLWRQACRTGHAALGKGPVYLYYFTWKSPMNGGKYISPHTVEIPFAFDTLKAAKKTANLTKDAPDAPALMEKVSAAWIAFAKTGNPNVPSLPHWPQFDAKSWPTVMFNNDSKVVSDPIHDQRLAIWSAMKL
ncbi:MAG TPA: carboxylesterase family protein [Rhizomicrobium sp.]|jgi:para-nitrobenzyl esterase|nr:carboxylesterase family protein [Rhizomicrobium sp.]